MKEASGKRARAERKRERRKLRLVEDQGADDLDRKIDEAIVGVQETLEELGEDRRDLKSQVDAGDVAVKVEPTSRPGPTRRQRLRLWWSSTVGRRVRRFRQRYFAWTRFLSPLYWFRIFWGRLYNRLVQDVATEIRQIEAHTQSQDMRVHIMLRPENWPGAIRRCDTNDGGCGARVAFPGLKRLQRADRQLWILRCPNCKKQRVMLTLTPKLDRLRRAALEDYRKTQSIGRPAFRRYEAAIIEHNKKLHAVRTATAKEGPGLAPEVDLEPAEAPDPIPGTEHDETP